MLLFFVSVLILFIGCQKDSELEELEDLDNEELLFEFPDANYIDSLVYLEIQKTCKDHWDLDGMEETTFVILLYPDWYSVYCVGQSGNQYAWHIIKTDLKGFWISNDKKDYSGRGTYFDFRNIDQLKLDSLRNFWIAPPVIDTSSTLAKTFMSHQNYIASELKTDKNGNSVMVSVFKTKADAVEAMEQRISESSCRINVGNSDALPGFWWYAECGGNNTVFINRWNTLFEVHRTNPEFKAVENTLYNTGNEMARRLSLLLD